MCRLYHAFVYTGRGATVRFPGAQLGCRVSQRAAPAGVCIYARKRIALVICRSVGGRGALNGCQVVVSPHRDLNGSAGELGLSAAWALRGSVAATSRASGGALHGCREAGCGLAWLHAYASLGGTGASPGLLTRTSATRHGGGARAGTLEVWRGRLPTGEGAFNYIKPLHPHQK